MLALVVIIIGIVGFFVLAMRRAPLWQWAVGALVLGILTRLGWTADGGPVALGVPGWNVRVYVLDEYLNPVPAGCPGELYLAGVQLADGYLHRTALTAERFVACPYIPGQRMYRTGDVVRWRADQQLEYLGRSDDQIKLRGVRIEPGEIEAVMIAHPLVSSARVVVREDRLVAYYLPAGAVETAAAELREHVAAVLPGHMVPSAFVAVEAFPLTPSGKLDRRALPQPEFGATSVGGRPPQTDRQRQLCVLFAATKADHIAAHQHAQLRALLDRLVGDARNAIRFEGAQVETMAIAALKCTESVVTEHEGRQLRCVRGVPVGRDRPTVLFPGEIPEDAEAFPPGRDRPYNFLPFRPPDDLGRDPRGLPHIRVDQALQFLLGGYLT